jgi:phage recombination protein Bet
MWDNKARQLRDVVMPGINLYRIQASRSGQFAGMSEPEYGPDITATLGGQKITYPEWCRVTVRRLLPLGTVAEFTAREFWIENYAVKGGMDKSVAPNAMWSKRPRGQIAKCASAQALRIAFPEIASAPTADEMEGRQMHADEAPAPSDDAPAELIERAETAASGGIAAYGAFWSAADKIERRALASRHADLKSMATDTDAARTIEADAEPADSEVEATQ